MNELEAWIEVEGLYRSCGVAHSPGSGQACLATALNGVTVGRTRYFLNDRMWSRLLKVTGGSGRISIPGYNDTHTKEENLAVLAQCRSECAAEQTTTTQQTLEVEKSYS